LGRPGAWRTEVRRQSASLRVHTMNLFQDFRRLKPAVLPATGAFPTPACRNRRDVGPGPGPCLSYKYRT
jgi:hypothetical protein